MILKIIRGGVCFNLFAFKSLIALTTERPHSCMGKRVCAFQNCGRSTGGMHKISCNKQILLSIIKDSGFRCHSCNFKNDNWQVRIAFANVNGFYTSHLYFLFATRFVVPLLSLFWKLLNFVPISRRAIWFFQCEKRLFGGFWSYRAEYDVNGFFCSDCAWVLELVWSIYQLINSDGSPNICFFLWNFFIFQFLMLNCNNFTVCFRKRAFTSTRQSQNRPNWTITCPALLPLDYWNVCMTWHPIYHGYIGVVFIIFHFSTFKTVFLFVVQPPVGSKVIALVGSITVNVRPDKIAPGKARIGMKNEQLPVGTDIHNLPIFWAEHLVASWNTARSESRCDGWCYFYACVSIRGGKC